LKNFLVAIGGGVILGVGIFLIVVFSSQVLLFLEGVVGILAGIAGGIILAIGASGVKDDIEERRRKREEEEKAKTREVKS